MQDLQGDLAVELGVGGLPDLAHSAFAEESGHVVVAEAGAGGQGHDQLEPRVSHSTPTRSTGPPLGTELPR